jgi:hypothetical protein
LDLPVADLRDGRHGRPGLREAGGEEDVEQDKSRKEGRGSP